MGFSQRQNVRDPRIKEMSVMNEKDQKSLTIS